MKRVRSNYLALFVLRLALLYFAFGVCRVAFAIYNWDLISPIPWSDFWSIVKAGFIFDSVSILYVNGLFILCSLLPLRLRERSGYQKLLMYLFIVVNGLALFINVADIYYFPFKLSRITSEDLHFLGGGNFGTLLISFLKDYWSGVLLWIGLIVLLWRGFRWLSYTPNRNRVTLTPSIFFISQLLLIGVVGAFSIFAIRGFTFSQSAYPITMSDASLYVNPKYASLSLSNPFCLIRTWGQPSTYIRYFDEADLDTLYPVIHEPLDSVEVSIAGRPNIVILVLESFGSAHVKSFSSQFPDDAPSYTPFLDSLAEQSYIFTNTFQNGLRSIDAMPAIWASIPSFKSQFLSLPGSVAEYKALPSCLVDMGYATMFLHGALRKSMSFVSFGQMAGVEEFYSREEYEAENGSGDFDGKWGIWDHKFLPFAVQKIDETREPFCATIFTLSSHHPYALPEGMEGKFSEGTLGIHPVIAYSDEALRNFFEVASTKAWFKNTLFILTADHGAGADSDKYRQIPYSYAVPMMFHYAGDNFTAESLDSARLVGKHTSVAQHIDIMPTVLRMIGYDEPFFGFGRDMFNDEDAGFAINYYGGAFNFISDSTRYLFNEHEVIGVYNYIEDPFAEHNKSTLEPSDSVNITRMKALIQQYYLHIKERRFRVAKR